MEKTLHRYTMILEPGEDGYIVAQVPALPGVWTQGLTRAEALSNAREAIELYVESLRAHDEPIPAEDAEFVEVA